MDLWASPKMLEARQIIREAARVDVTVLVTGETGTGKELVARAVHYFSGRRANPFVKVNCAAMPRELLESELFGFERGAFTGAHKLKIGKFEAAHHGTMFLDEIGDLHPALQAKLLHVLQDGEFSRIGGKSTLSVDVRVLAATNQDLERAVAEGRFREDLYYRLNVVHVFVPPLRERVTEIPMLVNYFVERYSKLYRRDGFVVPGAVMERLARHRYPGNVRELENLVKRMIVLDDPYLTRIPLPDPTAGGSPQLSPASEQPEPSLKEISRRASQAAGLTALELRDVLTTKLKDFIPNPEVTVIVSDVRSLKVSVIGEVARPGRYELKSWATVLDALALAGGFTQYASRSKIVILHPKGKSMEKIPFNYNEVSGKQENFYLRNGDIVLVP